MNDVLERPRPAVAVDELKRAWRAVQAGQFRHPATHSRDTAAAAAVSARAVRSWAAAEGERVLPVVGCIGAAGTSVTALAVATAAEVPARVVECSPVTASGLVAATTAELGAHPGGWMRGARGHVLVDRVGDVLVGADEIPAPTVPDRRVELTVLDAGWELGQLLATPCWLGEAVRTAPAVVAVTTATVPGLRRLEAALEMLDPARVVAAVVGPRRRKWARGVESGAGRHTRALIRTTGWVEVPADRGLAVAGVDSAPLPFEVLAAGARLLRAAGRHDTRGPDAPTGRHDDTTREETS